MDEEKITKEEMRSLINEEHAALDTALANLSEAQMMEPGAEGDWSVKDILAHISVWEDMMVTWLEESLQGKVPNRPAPGQAWDDIDALNARLFLENRDRGLDDVLDAYRKSYQRALQKFDQMTEEELVDPDRFAWRNGDPMWHMVAGNTWLHYQEHRETIEKWQQQP